MTILYLPTRFKWGGGGQVIGQQSRGEMEMGGETYLDQNLGRLG